MIAEKSSSSNVKVQALPDTIFAGLSFPSVPTSEIEIQPKELINREVTDINENESLLQDSTKSNKSNFSSTITQSIVNTVKDIDRRVKATMPPQDVKRQLSKLYAPLETIDSSSHGSNTSIYPDLPESENLLANRQNMNRSVISQNANSYINSNTSSYITSAPLTYGQQNVASVPIPMIHTQNNYHPSIIPNNNISYVHNGPQVLHNVRESTSSETEQLISDLIAQNQRLTQEIASLKTITGTGSASSAMESAFENDHTDTILGFEINSPALGIAMSGAPDTTNSTPAQGVKYICCGSCRHWFMTSKDIIFVTCPQCDAINNCGKNEPPRSSNTVSRTSGSTPWYLQCFK